MRIGLRSKGDFSAHARILLILLILSNISLVKRSEAGELSL